jgi:hypothetical protein
MRRSLLSVILLVMSRPDVAPAQDPPLGEHPAGLAVRYPGYHGLRSDPAVLLFEDFDVADLPSVVARWDNVGNAGGRVLALSDDVPAPAGTASIRSSRPPATLARSERIPRRAVRSVEFEGTARTSRGQGGSYTSSRHEHE